MSIKFKVLSLSLPVVMAASALVVMNASAESQGTGHFTSAASITVLDAVENPPNGAHMLELNQPGFAAGIVCHKASYAAEMSGTTVTSVDVFPTYKECTTTGGSTGSITVHPNGCSYQFKQPNKESAKTEHTVSINCPAGKKIEVTHGNCTVSISPQTVKGVGYTTTNEQAPGSVGGPKHSITLTVNVSFVVTRHGGFCILLAPTATGTLTGSVTVFGTSSGQVGITATGSVN